MFAPRSAPRARLLGVVGAAASAALLLAGCSTKTTPPGTVIPTSPPTYTTTPPEPMASVTPPTPRSTSEFGGPVQAGGGEQADPGGQGGGTGGGQTGGGRGGTGPVATTAPSILPGITPAPPVTSQLSRLLVGNEDLSGLDWRVTCSGLDASITVIATAKDGTRDLSVVLLGSTDKTLRTFSVTGGNRGASNEMNLSVSPGAGQGDGSLEVRDGLITSTGRGVKVGAPDGTAPVIYEFAATCASI